jgi:hypothetical protein
MMRCHMPEKKSGFWKISSVAAKMETKMLEVTSICLFGENCAMLFL